MLVKTAVLPNSSNMYSIFHKTKPKTLSRLILTINVNFKISMESVKKQLYSKPAIIKKITGLRIDYIGKPLYIIIRNIKLNSLVLKGAL